MVKITALFFTLLFMFSLAPQIYASSLDGAVNNSFRLAQSPKVEPTKPATEKESSIPEWVKRINFAIEAKSDKKPKYFFETIQPVLGTEEDNSILFNQSRISIKGERPIYNIGLGLRKILTDRYLVGINTFYDYQELHKHHRGGVGFEAINPRGLEARVNTYIRLSKERLVSEDAANQYYEKVANGLDYELGGPVPNFSFVKVYAGGYWYDFGHFANEYGWKLRSEFNPVKYSRLNFEVFNDTKRRKTGCSIEGAITLGFTSFALRDIIKDLTATQEPYPRIDLHKKMLDRVVRDFDITVIKTTKSKATGFTVEGGRS